MTTIFDHYIEFALFKNQIKSKPNTKKLCFQETIIIATK